MICNNETYPKKPVLPIMGMLKTLQAECPTAPPTNCTCHMNYVAPNPDGVTLQPFTTINCSYRGLIDLPDKLPSVTTTLLVKGNQISSLKPLVNNPHYRNVMDMFLDDNHIRSIEALEGTDWLLKFRVLSLRSNQLTEVPTYALDNALQRNRNAAIVHLGNNPWICDCFFTPSFQDFIIKYRKLVKDIDDVRCSSVHGDENSLTQIQALSRSAVCSEPSEYLIQPLDLLNAILASLIVLVIGKLIYDYWSFKKTGKLPWLVAKMP
ncbi:Protein singed wings 2 [Zootermopsis nevadensis]|uniref:Protein singed wings 2 n=2 Tax=Zootermopsis nevadensis TaxID=136037 RepID=A0A067RDZ9_ZOONE|nr:Protein singed wings 2 [Zootermopsis nevadensis]